MVDPSKDVGKEHISSSNPTGLDADPTTAGPANFRMLQEALLNEYAQKVSKVNNS